jgi:NADP-dependent 3-hydroxy acid dehydrogenase YdfG
MAAATVGTGDPATLRGRAGIITGGGSGIGAATAVELGSRGARLVVAELSRDRAAGVVADVRKRGGEIVPVEADVRSFADTLRTRDECLQAYGRIDFVVANAGVVDAGSMAEGDPERWRQVIETNVLGVAHTLRAVLPTMREQRSGDVVLIASASGRVSYVGEPIYVASKWAVVGLGDALRKEALEYGVRVTLVEPGLVDTPLSRSSTFGRALLEETEPLRAEDVARAVAFALLQPDHVGVNEILLRPAAQAL